MELRENMYIRTNEGIRKILYEYEEGYELDRYLHYRYPEGHHLYKEDLEDGENDIVIKASDKLIDLVEVKDIVLIEEFVDEACIIFEDMYYIQNENQLSNFKDSLIRNKNKKIKQILTKEMFEQMSYKVGE